MNKNKEFRSVVMKDEGFYIRLTNIVLVCVGIILSLLLGIYFNRYYPDLDGGLPTRLGLILFLSLCSSGGIFLIFVPISMIYTSILSARDYLFDIKRPVEDFWDDSWNYSLWQDLTEFLGKKWYHYQSSKEVTK